MKPILFVIYNAMVSFSMPFLLNNRIVSTKRKMADYTEDIENIQKFKDQFIKEDYSTFLQEIVDHKVLNVFINPSYTEMISKDNIESTILNHPIYHYHQTSANPFIVNKIVETAIDEKIPIYFTEFTKTISPFFSFQNIIENIYSFAYYAFPIFIIISIINAVRMNNNGGPMNNPMGTLNSFSNKNFQPINPNISLASWIGSPEVKEECTDVIAYLDNKDLFKNIGAEMPKGILLEGPPGTGKTLLAKAIATETNATFISISGSSFVELFVGMGAVKVRELFANARKSKPCIIFIDEIDAVGKQRANSNGVSTGTNEEREQTLNQLLYEMDGFNDNKDIVVIAATNRKDILDKALLRPGRLDRIIRVPLPDKGSREQIIEYYLKNKPIDLNKKIDISAIAELTDGYSGADLKNFINEAAILSAKNNFSTIQETFIYEAVEKSIVGIIKKNSSINNNIKKRVSIHEAGHALLVLKNANYFQLKKTSIQATYNGAGGYTLFTEKPEIKEGGLYTKEILKKRLVIAMGGKAAESLFFGNNNVSLGAIEDLKQANKLAKTMIRNYGMGENLEVYYNDENNEFMVSEKMKMYIDKESLKLMKDAYQEARRTLLENKVQFLQLSNILINNTIIYGNPFSYPKHNNTI
jgi:cell division protease FtsH